MFGSNWTSPIVSRVYDMQEMTNHSPSTVISTRRHPARPASLLKMCLGEKNVFYPLNDGTFNDHCNAVNRVDNAMSRCLPIDSERYKKMKKMTIVPKEKHTGIFEYIKRPRQSSKQARQAFTSEKTEIMYSTFNIINRETVIKTKYTSPRQDGKQRTAKKLVNEHWYGKAFCSVFRGTEESLSCLYT